MSTERGAQLLRNSGAAGGGARRGRAPTRLTVIERARTRLTVKRARTDQADRAVLSYQKVSKASGFGERMEDGAGQRGIMFNPFLLACQVSGRAPTRLTVMERRKRL